MKAMLLAAGRGERMRPLTDICPKPLLKVGGQPLIVWHLQRLATAGFAEVVINHAHLGEQLVAALGDGSSFGLHIRYSPEPTGALETAGGIANALPCLGNEPFLVINADIYCDWDFSRARDFQSNETLAHLVLVDNPLQHPQGDFTLDSGKVGAGGTGCAGNGGSCLTFSGIGIYRPALFAGIARGAPAKLAPLLRQHMPEGKISGERHDGLWTDVGTPQRLRQLDEQLRETHELCR